MPFPFLQLLFNSLIIGSVYALVAVGFSLIYSTNRFMHFAHGASVVIAGYSLFSFFTILGIPFALSSLLTLLLSAVVGYGMFKFVYQPLQNKKSSTVILLIASIAILILVENLVLLFYGAGVRSIGLLETAKGIAVGSANITPLQIILILISMILLLSLYLFLNKSRLGRDLRAVADNKELAAIMGLNTEKLLAISFIIGSALAGIAGILIGLEQNLDPTMGTSLMVKGFSGAVIGGIYSVLGSVLGSYIVGLVENFGSWYLPSGFKDAITFTLLFLFLLFRPVGLLGIEKGVKG
ncbi:MAG: branched-chain amino acid ABC transporter permease [Nanoarchaeota archaeon]